MLGVKLRSDRVDTYDELGERGQPVYRVAPQILEVLRRQLEHPDLAKHFAVPQANDDGTVVDWYAPEEGEVIPWSSATPEERQAMRSQILGVEKTLEGLAAKIRAKDASGDRRLLGALLHWVTYFPDFSYIYQVNQRAVVCFWGFLHAGADRSRNPLHIPDVVPEPVPPASPAVEPAITPAAPVMPSGPSPAAMPLANDPPRTPWWKRWWMWLLLALLLLLLLFGLRSCFMQPALPTLSLPSVTPTLPDLKVDPPSVPNLASQASGLSLPSLPTFNGSAGGASTGGLPAGVPDTGRGGTAPLMPAAPEPGAGNASPVPPTVPDIAAAPTPADDAQAALAPPLPSDNQAARALPSTLPATAPGSDPGAGLAIPAGAKDGRADFLNGHWRAGAGIQDRATGAPLRLEYQFEKGEGHVLVRRHNGVECKASTSASMAGGALSLTNSSQAACSDGTAYELPKVECKPNARESAHCQGSYGDVRFPISMRQANP